MRFIQSKRFSFQAFSVSSMTQRWGLCMGKVAVMPFIRVDMLRDIVGSHPGQIHDYVTLVRLFRERGLVVKRIAYFRVAEK
jgi:hypothetical protein